MTDSMQHLSNAMFKAREAFDEYFEEKGLDAGYWDLKLHGFVLETGSFEPMKEIEMDFKLNRDKMECDIDD